MARMNESSFQYVPTMMDEQPCHNQINRPMFENESDIIGEEESQNISSSLSSTSHKAAPAN